jgi:hypothetical protein
MLFTLDDMPLTTCQGDMNRERMKWQLRLMKGYIVLGDEVATNGDEDLTTQRRHGIRSINCNFVVDLTLTNDDDNMDTV